jgi:uncharacterized short protein YbdD (DUF466 family)
MSQASTSGFAGAFAASTARILLGAQRLGRALWSWLRQVSGDAAYENYFRRARPRYGESRVRVLSREEFYLDALRRRYTGVSRCC